MMKSRTNNKIVFCQNCISPLTPHNDRFCNTECQSKKAERQAEMNLDTALKAEWVYLNKNMLDLAKSYHVEPHEFSYFFWSGHELVGVAAFDMDTLEKTITAQESNTYDAWYRPIGRLNMEIEPHDAEMLREEGLLGYLSDNYGIVTERNIAAAIGEITNIEGHDSPIELINSL